MIPKFEVFIIIQKPISEVFDAVYNPKKLSGYFVTAGASAPMVEGTTVQWEFADFPGPFPVKVKQTVQNKQISFEWQAPEGGHDNLVEFVFEELNPTETKVKIYETGWKDHEVKASYGNCMGWSQMACAMKAYLEHGINLRQGAYKPLSET
jgi:uncharacterized protein YndB with AHSA1/START domain